MQTVEGGAESKPDAKGWDMRENRNWFEAWRYLVPLAKATVYTHLGI